MKGKSWLNEQKNAFDVKQIRAIYCYKWTPLFTHISPRLSVLSLPAVVLTPVLRSSLLRRMERRVLSSIFNRQYSIFNLKGVPYFVSLFIAS
jgi:hypothetical protein